MGKLEIPAGFPIIKWWVILEFILPHTIKHQSCQRRKNAWPPHQPLYGESCKNAEKRKRKKELNPKTKDNPNSLVVSCQTILQLFIFNWKSIFQHLADLLELYEDPVEEQVLGIFFCREFEPTYPQIWSSIQNPLVVCLTTTLMSVPFYAMRRCSDLTRIPTNPRKWTVLIPTSLDHKDWQSSMGFTGEREKYNTKKGNNKRKRELTREIVQEGDSDILTAGNRIDPEPPSCTKHGSSQARTQIPPKLHQSHDDRSSSSSPQP